MTPREERTRVGLAHPVTMVAVIVATVVIALGLVLLVGVASTQPSGPPPALAGEAQPRVQRLLSYTPETIESDLPVEETYLTGDYRTEYADLITDVLIPKALRSDVSVEASITDTAVVDATPETMVVLMIAEVVTTQGAAASESSTGRFRVTLQNVDDAWLISGLDEI